jgi:hypothetical protein
MWAALTSSIALLTLGVALRAADAQTSATIHHGRHASSLEPVRMRHMYAAVALALVCVLSTSACTQREYLPGDAVAAIVVPPSRRGGL